MDIIDLKKTAVESYHVVQDTGMVNFHPSTSKEILNFDGTTVKELLRTQVFKKRLSVAKLRHIESVENSNLLDYGPKKKRDNGDKYDTDLRKSIYSIIYSCFQLATSDDELPSEDEESKLFRHVHEKYLFSPLNETYVLFQK